MRLSTIPAIALAKLFGAFFIAQLETSNKLLPFRSDSIRLSSSVIFICFGAAASNIVLPEGEMLVDGITGSYCSA